MWIVQLKEIICSIIYLRDSQSAIWQINCNYLIFFRRLQIKTNKIYWLFVRIPRYKVSFKKQLKTNTNIWIPVGCLPSAAGGGVSGQGVCLPRGGLPGGGVYPGGVSAWWGEGGVYLGGCLPDNPLWTESQTVVKTLPCRNYARNGNYGRDHLIQGWATRKCPPEGPSYFIFMQFLVKIMSNNRFLSPNSGVCAPSLSVWEILDPPVQIAYRENWNIFFFRCGPGLLCRWSLWERWSLLQHNGGLFVRLSANIQRQKLHWRYVLLTFRFNFT